MIAVEVVYALPDRALVVPLRVEPGTTVRTALERSGLLEQCPEIDLASVALGSFGRALRLDDVVQDAERIEIYRPLTRDPKDLRRERARRR